MPEIKNNISSHKTKLQIDMKKYEKPLLKFKSNDGFLYNIYRRDVDNYNPLLLAEIYGDGSIKSFLDVSARADNIYEYYIVSTSMFYNNKQKSNSVKVMSY